MPAENSNLNIELAEFISQFYDDPLGFVMAAFPWDSDPSIQLVELEEPYKSDFNCKYGPDVWACEFLDSLGEQIEERGFDGINAVDPILEAVSSGHGIGKSAISAWLILFVASTRPFSKGVVTSNTSDQLKTKTWGELGKWKKKCITGHWFTYNNGKGNMNLFQNDNPESWRVDAQTCREENSESFAGLHAANSTPWYLFDEASAVPDKIWEVAEGGTTDGEPMWFVFGNPTRNTGRFRDCFAGGRFSHRWNARKVDSRSVQVTNKNKMKEWVDDYGEDSDFVRVRVRGEFPRAAVTQFIPGDAVLEAMERQLPANAFAAHKKVMGVDVARFGDDRTVIGIRQGPKLFEPEIHRELDTTQVTARVVNLYHEHKPHAIFVDGIGVGAGVVDQLKRLGLPVVDVQVSRAATKQREYANLRSQIWGEMRDWLIEQEVDIPKNQELREDLIGPEYNYNAKMQIQLEKKSDMKKRGLSSPDIGDMLSLTFAPFSPMEITHKPFELRQRKVRQVSSKGWS